uniref:Uncharacterized protein n=1 Tax=Arundo donax TaxID=35708 RepID=A0A0A8ZAF3_ARUDO
MSATASCLKIRDVTAGAAI